MADQVRLGDARGADAGPGPLIVHLLLRNGACQLGASQPPSVSTQAQYYFTNFYSPVPAGTALGPGGLMAPAMAGAPGLTPAPVVLGQPTPAAAGDAAAHAAPGDEQRQAVGAQAVGAAAQQQRSWVSLFDFKLMLKLAILVAFFAQDGDRKRLTMLCAAAVFTYMYQVGILGFLFRGPAPGAGRVNRGVAAAPRRAPLVPPRVDEPRQLTILICIERFIVGFFASLLPSWTPPM